MARFYGTLGFSITAETKPGVWTSSVTEHEAFGDIIRYRNDYSQQTGSTNDDLVISSQVSVIMDPFILANVQRVVYVKFMDIAWKVKSIEPSYPRLTLTLGGVYNGEQA